MSLGVADHHLRVPRDPRQNLKWRIAFLDAVRSAGPAGVEACRRLCQEDFLFWLNVFGNQINGKKRGGPQAGPFCSYPFQDAGFRRMLGAVEQGRDLAVQKSRQIGASWMLAFLFTWLWLFHRWQTLHLVSRKADLVFDAGNEMSLYYKISYLLRYLPNWMLPKDWSDEKKQYTNRDLESVITGEATSEKAGVGGNKTAVGIDEFAQIDQGAEINQRTTETTNCRIFVSTHLGTDTEFFQIINRGDTDVLTMHWSEHPLYRRGLYRYDPDADLQQHPDRIIRLDPDYVYPPDYPFVRSGLPAGGPYPGVRSPWYDEQCRRKGSARAVAMDLDIDPAGSASQFFDPMLVARLKAKDCRPPVWTGRILYDRDTGDPEGLSPDAKGPLKLWEQPDLDGKLQPGLFVVGCDIAYGRGATPQVAVAYRVFNGVARQVARYSNAHIEAKEFGVLAVALCRLLATRAGVGAQLVWEKQGAAGGNFRDSVQACGYRNIYYWTDPSKDPPQRSDTPGFFSSDQTKGYLLEAFHSALLRGLVQVRDELVLNECLEFRYDAKGLPVHSRSKNKDKPEESGEAHADHAIAAALAWMLVGELPETGEGEEGTLPPPSPYSFAGRVALSTSEDQPLEQWW